MKSIISVIVVILVLTIFTGFVFSNTFIGIWHIVHLAKIPDDLFIPILVDDFEFNKQANSKEYELNPKYRDIYEISIFSENGINKGDFGTEENGYALEGKYKIEMFNHDQKISEKVITKWRSATFTNKDKNTYNALTLYEFPVPLKGFSIQSIKLKITVIEPSKVLETYKNDIRLQVKVSATP